MTDISWDRFYISKQGFKIFTDFRVFFKSCISIVDISLMVFVMVR